MEATQDNYLTAYRHLELTRYAQGVTLVQMHGNGGPLTFTAKAHTEVADTFPQIPQDRVNKIVILAGAGGDFMIGVDWSSFPGASDRGVCSQIHEPPENIVDIRVPVFAVVEGRAQVHSEYALFANVILSGTGATLARELAAQYLKAPEVTRRNTRIHFIRPLKERILRRSAMGSRLRVGQRPIWQNRYGVKGKS